MDKNEQIVFKKYSQLYAGTFQSQEGNRVKVASVTGGIHTVDASDVQTREQYLASVKARKEEVVDEQV